MAVISTFATSGEAMRRYVELHSADLYREFYVVHTSRAELDIKERRTYKFWYNPITAR